MLDTYHFYDGGHIQVHINLSNVGTVVRAILVEYQGPHSGILRVILVQAEIFKKIPFSCILFVRTAVISIRQLCEHETFGNKAQYILKAHSKIKFHDLLHFILFPDIHRNTKHTKTNIYYRGSSKCSF